MGIFRKYPYTNFSTINLDWLLAKMKELEQIVKGGTVEAVITPATRTKLGGIKVGRNLSVTEDGTLSADDQGGAYTLPTASEDTLGGIKVGEGLQIDATGKLSTAGGGELPIATGDSLGCVIVGDGLTISEDGVLSAADRFIVTENSDYPIYYVSAAGSNSNDGSELSPFATLKYALESTKHISIVAISIIGNFEENVGDFDIKNTVILGGDAVRSTQHVTFDKLNVYGTFYLGGTRDSSVSASDTNTFNCTNITVKRTGKMFIYGKNNYHGLNRINTFVNEGYLFMTDFRFRCTSPQQIKVTRGSNTYVYDLKVNTTSTEAYLAAFGNADAAGLTSPLPLPYIEVKYVTTQSIPDLNTQRVTLLATTFNGICRSADLYVDTGAHSQPAYTTIVQ